MGGLEMMINVSGGRDDYKGRGRLQDM
jgi:hypothetical protein